MPKTAEKDYRDPVVCRAVLVRAKADGWSEADAASEIGCSVSTFRAWAGAGKDYVVSAAIGRGVRRLDRRVK